jgi:hypothetical protein
MKKKGILLTVVILLSAAGLTQALEGELRGVIDLTYQSKYIWRGFDIYGDKSAFQPSIDLDLYQTGFGINLMAHRANSSGYENDERWDYTVYYGNSIFEGERYATNYRLGYVYYNFPDTSSHTRSTPTRLSTDLQEMQLVLSWPEICPAGVVPTYVLVKMWPSNSDSSVSEFSGWAHIFMLNYGLNLGTLIPEMPEQVLNLYTEMVYNDGVGLNPATGQVVEHDWTNIVFGISTDFDLGNDLTFTPGIFHQVTMDDSVNDDKDETWVSLSMKYRF